MDTFLTSDTCVCSARTRPDTRVCTETAGDRRPLSPPCGSQNPPPITPPKGRGGVGRFIRGPGGGVFLGRQRSNIKLFLSDLVYPGLQVVKITHLLAAFVARAMDDLPPILPNQRNTFGRPLSRVRARAPGSNGGGLLRTTGTVCICTV